MNHVTNQILFYYIFSGNGYIEGTELDGFLREFVSSANVTDIAPEVSPNFFYMLKILLVLKTKKLIKLNLKKYQSKH